MTETDFRGWLLGSVGGDSEVRASSRLALAASAPDWKQACLRALRDEDPRIRHGAVYALEYLNLPATEINGLLIYAFSDAESYVRAAACWLAEENPPLAAICAQAISALANDSHWSVRQAAVAALAAAWRSNLTVLSEAARCRADSSVQVRAAVADAMAGAAQPARFAIATLAEMLGDSEHAVRRDAARSLRRITRSFAGLATELAMALDDVDFDVREHITHALAVFGGGAVPAIPKLLSNLERSVDSLRKATGAALVSIGPPAVDALIAALASESWQARIDAAISLGQIEPASPETVKALESASREREPRLRAHACESLYRITKNTRLVGTLLAELKAGNATAAAVLGRIGARAATPALLTRLKSTAGEEKLVFAVALARLRCRDPDYLAEIEHMLGDHRAHIREAAARIWACINRPKRAARRGGAKRGRSN